MSLVRLGAPCGWNAARVKGGSGGEREEGGARLLTFAVARTAWRRSASAFTKGFSDCISASSPLDLVASFGEG
jgi:hypothetical protein